MSGKKRENSLKYWILASRPKTLPGALVPVFVACSCVYADGMLKWHIALLCMLFACCMQISSNLINDLYDYLKGTDREDRLGPLRACAQGWISASAMKTGIILSIALSCIFGIIILLCSYPYMQYNGVELVIVGVLCIVFAYLYTTCLSYIGLGDLLVVVFFGIVPVTVTYYVQTSSINISVILLSLVCGIATDALLVINNYRDREQDKISKKKTTVVLFGEKFGRYHYLFSGIIPALIIILIPLIKQDSIYYTVNQSFVVSLVYLVLHIYTWKKMIAIYKGRELNTILGSTARNILVLGVLLSIFIICK